MNKKLNDHAAGDWSRGPERRAKPAAGSVVLAPLGLAIFALLAAGMAGVAVHRSALTTPAGFQRLVDSGDHLSLAVPADWQVPALTTKALTSQMQTFKITDPQLAALADIALAALQKVQLGVFAIDVGTRTSLFAYGADDPALERIDQISPAALVAQINALGGRHAQARKVNLALGAAERVSVQLAIGTETISELVDYFVLHNRLVAIVVIARGSQAPSEVLSQIEKTLAPA